MCLTCECLRADIREAQARLNKMLCNKYRKVGVGQHKRRIKQPDRQKYYSDYYQANREKKLAYYKARREEEKRNAHIDATSAG